jgi:glycerol-3-phosphate dehydrogenase
MFRATRLVTPAKVASLLFVGGYITHRQTLTMHAQKVESEMLWKPPSRDEIISRMKTTPEFDLLVIGGGATGSGCALDAATRGLNVALVERDDYASGTSSKSTKMLHGGVRYLEKAIMGLDFAQFSLVWEALHERATVMKNAPHVSYELAILLPVYQYVHSSFINGN